MEDWTWIRRLAADGVPQRQVARDLGIAGDTGASMRADLVQGAALFCFRVTSWLAQPRLIAG